MRRPLGVAADLHGEQQDLQQDHSREQEERFCGEKEWLPWRPCVAHYCAVSLSDPSLDRKTFASPKSENRSTDLRQKSALYLVDAHLAQQQFKSR